MAAHKRRRSSRKRPPFACRRRPPEKAEGETIVGIEPADNRASPPTTSFRTSRKSGSALQGREARHDVRALWDSGFFDDIEVDLTRERRAASRSASSSASGPNIKTIEFAGNEEIENDKLTEADRDQAQHDPELPAVRRSVQKIKDKYAEKGYFLADVDYEVVPQRDNEVIVKFKIIEHEPVTVRRITFIGNDHVPDDELREVMHTGQRELLRSFGSGGPFRQDVFERDVLVLNALYYDKGFLARAGRHAARDAHARSRTASRSRSLIHEGPRYKIRQLRIYERTTTARRSSRSAAAAHLRADGPRQVAATTSTAPSS